VTRTPADGWDATERRALQQVAFDGGALRCPRCGTELTQQPVEPGGAVAYVRRRILVICPECRRSAGLDLRRG
jgi:uncharacterized protein with PIN domain